ncbi:MAG: D-alanyl-D-alanine carboxypeptidase/D-alanyl-D-alanine-endopeptidase [Gemmatimonadota bacterium]
MRSTSSSTVACLAVLLASCSGVGTASAPAPSAGQTAARPSATPAGGGDAVSVSRDTVYVVREVVADSAPTDVFVPLESDRLEESSLTRPAAVGETVLIERVAAIIDRPPYDQVHWGIVAKDLHDGHVLLSLNAHHTFAPASNQKVLTGAAVLSALGPDHRFRTGVFATGPTRRGSVDGALVLVGVGDPTWSEAFHPSWRTVFDALADSLLAQGARRFSGPLLIDASAWDTTGVPGSWMVEDVGWSWGASGGPFVVAGGQVALTVSAAQSVGGSASVSAEPRLASGRVRVEVRSALTDSARVQSRPPGEDGRLVVSGTVPPGWRRTLRIAQGDPVRVAGELLYEVLTERGISFEGGLAFAWDAEAALVGGCAAGRVPDCPAARRLATLTSPPLIEIVQAALEPSDNFITDQLAHALAQATIGRGGWRQVPEALETELGRSFNVLSRDVEVVDGSGLSIYNLVTPRALVDVLTQMRIRPGGDRFRAALPEPGERGSTMAGRLRSLQGRVFAKTGSLTHVNSLSGYLVRDNGREMVFSILSNGSGLDSDEVRDAIDRLVVELARW